MTLVLWQKSRPSEEHSGPSMAGVFERNEPTPKIEDSTYGSWQGWEDGGTEGLLPRRRRSQREESLVGERVVIGMVALAIGRGDWND